MPDPREDLGRVLARRAKDTGGDREPVIKVAILAGGQGTRLVEETEERPKPMVEIGTRPIVWHIMRHYAHYGWTDFVLALGYKGEHIKRYMLGSTHGKGDVTVRLSDGPAEANGESCDGPWTVTLVDTGQTTNTGGRIKRLSSHLGDSTFFLTWGDGVSDLDLRALLAFHRSHGRLATLTAVHPPGRFGRLELNGDRVMRFAEKERPEGEWINGAFFVLEPEVLAYIDGDATHWEGESLPKLARDGQLMAYRHEGFWQCMDTLHDKRHLEELWADEAPWRVWS